ncbi:uncharacterized protein LOC141614645 [Silene latifolia]|uniref:uncharacterized protein LOC141614645 n=1 Tax=Silene latifolia TaxID=37657 RepID=UPI003D77E91C
MSVVPKKPRVGVVDVMGMNDYVFALYNDGAIQYWDVNKSFGILEGIVQPMDHSPSWFNTLEYYEEGWTKAYLVQSGKNLLLVVRYTDQAMNSDKKDVDYDLYYETLGFEVYKINPKDTSCEIIDDLGDLALFVGGNYSMCVTVGPKSLERNCIYFTDDQNEDWTLVTEFGGHDMGIYDIKCDEFRPFYEGIDTRSSYCPPIWFVPQF